MNFVTAWALSIFIMSGPQEGNRVDLTAYEDLNYCIALADHLNIQNSQVKYEGPKIVFRCVREDAI